MQHPEDEIEVLHH